MRELVGYLRFDTEAELGVLNRIWELDRIYTNYLLAQQKLVSKQRHGAKVTKRHDRAATPFERASGPGEHHRGGRVRDEHESHGNAVRPGEALPRISTLTAHSNAWRLTKTLDPRQATVNRAFNPITRSGGFR